MKSKQMENAINEVNQKYKGKRERYSMSCSEWIELAKMATDKPFEAVVYAFDYGFVKGIRFEKSRLKNKEKALSQQKA